MTPPLIRLVAITSDGVELDLGTTGLKLSWTWLRDHARDPGSFLESAQQRLVAPSTVAAAGPGTVVVTAEGLEIEWPDGPNAVFDPTFLSTLGDQAGATTVGSAPEPWDRSTLRDRLARIGFDDLTSTADGLAQALDQLWTTGVAVVVDVPIDRDSTRRVLERFGYVRATIFGDLWDFSSDGGFDDTASTPLEITPHTDGTYSHDAPGLLGLHCHEYRASGGENVFVDGVALADQLCDTARTVLAEVDIPAQYIGDGSWLMSARPVLRYHGGRLAQVSYNHHDRAPFVLPEPTMSDLYSALHEFDALASSPELQVEVAMRPGDMVIVDNWRVLHGRRAFRGERLIAGGYINREDVESTTRLLTR